MTTTRREFIGYVGLGCLAGVGLLSQGCATTPVYRTSAIGGNVELLEDEFNALIADGNAILVRMIEGDPVLLVRVAQNEYVALSAVCTHQKCEVRAQQTQLECPCHGSTFSFEGAVTRGPAKRALTSYAVVVANETIQIDLTKTKER